MNILRPVRHLFMYALVGGLLYALLLAFACGNALSAPLDMDYVLDLSGGNAENWVLPAGYICTGNKITTVSSGSTSLKAGYYSAVNWSGKYTFSANINNLWGSSYSSKSKILDACLSFSR